MDADSGYEWHASEVKLADVSKTGGSVKKSLVADHPIEATIRFLNVNKQINSLSRLEVKSYKNSGGFVAKINNVSVR